jgi:asparagine synthetase B (glutamine-hydrolysing)
MCGIAGAYLRDPKLSVDLDAVLDTMLDKIEHRGGDATGFIALDSKGVAEWHRAAVGVRDFSKHRRLVPNGTKIIMCHTRFATQGLPGFNENNHPIRRGSFYVVHNGHVSNDQELFKLSGRVPFGQVDSEAISARLASLGSLDKADVVMEEIEGAAAIAAVDSNDPKRLVLARGHSSPLYVLVTDKIVLWGSTQDTVKVAYKKHVGRLPKKAKIEYVPEGTMLVFDGRKLTRTEFEPYKPKYVPSYQYKTWKDDDEAAKQDDACIVPTTETLRGLPTVGGWPKWDDDEFEEDNLLECDVCSATVSWREADFVMDKHTDLCWTLCGTCRDVDLEAFSFGGTISEDPAEVSALLEDEEGQ